MAGPDTTVPRSDGVLRARIEARHADPMEMEVSVKVVTVRRVYEVDGEVTTSRETFPVVELEGFEASDLYRFAPAGSSWSEMDVEEEQVIETVDLEDVDTEELPTDQE